MSTSLGSNQELNNARSSITRKKEKESAPDACGNWLLIERDQINYPDVLIILAEGSSAITRAVI